MRKHRIFIPHPLTAGQNVTLDKTLSHYISRVLRLHTGYTVFLFNNTGNEYAGIIHDITHNHVLINITNLSHTDLARPLQITVAQVLGKGDKMDTIIQKTTELGVDNIVPLYSEFAVAKNVPDRSAHKLEHWEKIAIAACCQCERNTIPTIQSPLNLTTWLQAPHSTTSLNLILAPHHNGIHLNTLPAFTHVNILVGPEGGFSDNETALAIRHHYIAINLGPRILRTETAAIAAVAAIQAMYGDL